MKKKKILFISPLPPPYYGSAMSSKMCLDILNEFKDFEVRNVKLNYSKEMSDVGKFNLQKITGFFKTKNKIKKELISFRPDLVYFMPATSGLGLKRDYHFVKTIKKYYTKKILFHIRARLTNKDWSKKSNKRKYVEMFRGQKAIVLDEKLKSDLKGLISPEDLHILPNAIKNEITKTKLNKIISSRKKKKSLEILFISNMDSSKGWPKLLLACSLLKKESKDFNCRFIGAWPNIAETKKFHEMVKSHGLEDNVEYLGKKVGLEKSRVFEKSNALVFPTEYRLETFGRVVIEAMMYALPVIANGVAAIPTTIKHGKTGFVLSKNSPKEIANYLLKLTDAKKREKMGLNGRKRFLKEYKLKKYKKKFMSLFD